MTEPEKSSDLGEISAVTAVSESDSTDGSMRIFSHAVGLTQKPKVKDQHDAR